MMSVSKSIMPKRKKNAKVKLNGELNSDKFTASSTKNEKSDRWNVRKVKREIKAVITIRFIMNLFKQFTFGRPSKNWWL